MIGTQWDIGMEPMRQGWHSMHGDETYDWGEHWGKWLHHQMEIRALTRPQFVERSPKKANGRPEIDNTMLGRLDGQRPTFDKAVAVAETLHLPPTEVVREAGFLASPDQPLIINDGERDHLIMQLDSDDEVRAVRAFLEILRENRG